MRKGYHVFLQSLALRGMLSFVEDSPPVKLEPLNVLIGPNGSGKSNFIDGIDLLRSTASELAKPVREGGGVGEWFHKPTRSPLIRIIAGIGYDGGELVHELEFGPRAASAFLELERIESGGSNSARHLLAYRAGTESTVELFTGTGHRKSHNTRAEENSSFLRTLVDQDTYPELWHLTTEYEHIKIYREWQFGRNSPLRSVQQADQRNDHLDEGLGNLGLILSRFRIMPRTRDALLLRLRDFLPSATNYEVVTQANSVQLFLEEEGKVTPSVRLSDGTLKYLCLLAILLDPEPPPLVCIEEPEIGLHPDVLPGLADLLVEASHRVQLIVTTHSDILVSALSAYPSSVIVCENLGGSTSMARLDPSELKPWLENYRLGELWMKGNLGGTRW